MFYNQVSEKLKEESIVFGEIIFTTTKNLDKTSKFEELFQIDLLKIKDSDITSNKHTEEFKKKLLPLQTIEADFLNEFEVIQSLLSQVTLDVKALALETVRSFFLLALKNMQKKFPYTSSIINNTSIIFFADLEFDKKKWLELMDRFKNIISTERIIS